MSDLSAAHAHNALTSAVQMYGAALADQQKEIENFRANLALKQLIIEAEEAKVKDMQVRIKEGTAENKRLIEELNRVRREFFEAKGRMPDVPESRLSDRGACHPECQSPSCPGCAIPNP